MIPGRHSQRARRALQKLAEDDPAFAAIALWVHHRDADAPPEGIGDAPAWTDGRAVFYGPDFPRFTLAEQVGLAAHQLAHVAFRHVPRSRAMLMRFGAAFDAELFNLGADAILNEMLFLAGYVLPRPCPRLTPLLEEALSEKVAPEQAIGAWDVETLYVSLSGARSQAAGGSRDGGRAGPRPADAARAHAARTGFRADLDARHEAPGGAAQTAEEDGEWRQRLARALQEGRRAGRGIGALGHRVADLPQSAVPWERHLRGLLSRALLDDPQPSWHRPTGRWLAAEDTARRRAAPVPVFEPGRRRAREAPRLVLGIDASSSVDDATLRLFAAQVAAIGRRSRGEVHVLVFDEAVRSTIRLSGANWALEVGRMRFARGGGTAYGDLFDRAVSLVPSALVVLTDLDAALPPRPGRLPVIWAVPRAPARAPAWGRVVPLDR